MATYGVENYCIPVSRPQRLSESYLVCVKCDGNDGTMLQWWRVEATDEAGRHGAIAFLMERAFVDEAASPRRI